MDNNVLIAFMLTLLAGISTGIGSAIAFFAKRTNTSFLSVSLGFSAGVMIYVSFAELLPNAIISLSDMHGVKTGTIYATISFFAGILLIMLIDKFVPKYENPHEMRSIEDISQVQHHDRTSAKQPSQGGLLRVGMVTALVLAIHNFPEGISVSVPVFYATGNRKKAFWLSFLSGLAEPLGALIGYAILAPFLNDNIFGIIFGIIAGIMVFISLDELLPAAETYGKHHLAIYGMVAGMAVMAVSLLLF